MGILFLAAPKKHPQSPAISSPPTLASTSSTSFPSGLFISRAFATTLFLFSNCSLVRPTPIPTVCSGLSPDKALKTAALVVVFPMPSSPVPRRSYPSFASLSTVSIPTSTAFTACSLVIAGPLEIFWVPQAIFLSIILGLLNFALTPISITFTSAPACFERIHTPMIPFAIFSVSRAVTLCGAALTPSSATPLSAHMTMIPFLLSSLCTLPVIPANLTAISSSMPRLPMGFAR